MEVSWRRGTSAARGRSAAVGVSSPEWVTIRAILPGRLTVQLFQRRSWETVTEPRRQHTIVVRTVPSARRDQPAATRRATRPACGSTPPL